MKALEQFRRHKARALRRLFPTGECRPGLVDYERAACFERITARWVRRFAEKKGLQNATNN
jgi:hypothetical protein